MADKEAAPKRQEAVIICLYPDVCKSPDKPIPYQIVAYYGDMQKVSQNVRITGVPATNKDSRIPRVYNNEPGVGGGVQSGVNVGYCRPTKDWSSTINVNGTFLLRHGTQFDMNCCGPDGAANTQGKTVYLTGTPVARISADGSIQGDTKPPVQANEEEKGWLSRAWDNTKDFAGEAVDGAKELDQKYKIVTRATGALQAGSGVVQMAAGAVGIAAPTGVTQVLGVVAVVHGADDAATGLTQLWTGGVQQTLTEQAATAASTALGATPELAANIGSSVDMFAGGISPSNLEKVAVKKGAERAAKELAEKEAKELAEKEAKQLSKNQAKDLSEKKAKEAAEKKAKEAAEKDGAQVKGEKEGGGGNGPCKLLAAAVYAKVPKVASRFLDKMTDKYKLFVRTVNPDGTKGIPYRDPNTNKLIGSWHGHKQQLEQKQKTLREAIQEYDEAKCKQPKIPVPVRDLAYYPIPEKPGGIPGYPFTQLPR